VHRLNCFAPHMASLTFPVRAWLLPVAMRGTTVNPVLNPTVAIQTCNIRKRDIRPRHCFHALGPLLPRPGPTVGCNLIRFFANLLSSTLSRQGLLHPTLCARFQIEGVALHFLNDVFGLNLALESTESAVY